jgi:hypothetical protein
VQNVFVFWADEVSVDTDLSDEKMKFNAPLSHAYQRQGVKTDGDCDLTRCPTGFVICHHPVSVIHFLSRAVQ